MVGIIPPSAVLAWMLCIGINTLQECDSQKRGLVTLLNPGFIPSSSTKAVLVLRFHKETQPWADWFVSSLLNAFHCREVAGGKALTCSGHWRDAGFEGGSKTRSHLRRFFNIKQPVTLISETTAALLFCDSFVTQTNWSKCVLHACMFEGCSCRTPAAMQSATLGNPVFCV